MSVNYNNTVKNARLQVVADAIAAGAAPGVLEIGTAGMAAVLVAIPLTDPPTVLNQVLTLLAAPETEAAIGTGTAAEARVVDSDDNVVISGLTVGVAASDVIVDSTNITTGQNVTVSTGTISHP